MADLSIGIEILATDKASSVFGGVQKGIGGLLGGFRDLGLGVLGIGAAFDAGKSAIEGLIGPAIEAQQVASQTAAVLKSTGEAAGLSIDDISGLAGSLSKLTPFEDEAIQSAENLLLTFTNIGKDIFPDATETVLNMSQALGQDLKSSSVQLGKALNDPIKGITALSRVGVSFTEEQKDQIKVLQESGDMMGAQKVILGELEKEFGGAAKAAGQTFGGQMVILQTAVGNVMEAIGGPLIKVLSGAAVAILPFVQGFADDLPAAIDSFMASLAPVGQVLSSLIGYFVAVVEDGDTLNDFLADMPGFLQPIVQGFGEMVAALPSVLQTVGDAFTTIQQVFAGDWSASESIDPIVNAVGNLASIVRDDVLPALSTFGDFVSDHFQDIMAGAGAVLLGIVVPAFAAWAIAAGTAAAATLVALAPIIVPIAAIGLAAAGLHAAWTSNFLGIQDVTAAAWAVLQPIFEGILTEVGRFGTEMLPLATAAWTNLSNIVGNVASALWVTIQTGVAGLVSFWKTNHTAIEQIVSVTWGLIEGYVKVSWDIISGVIKTGLQVLSGDWSGAWQTIQDTVGNAWTHIQEAIGPAWELISGLVGKGLALVLDGISKWATNSLNAVAASMATLGQGILDGIKNGIAAGWSSLASWFGSKIATLNPFAGGGNPFAGGLAVGQLGMAGQFGPGPAPGTLTQGNPGQFGIGLDWDTANAACGPYAALVFANAVGRTPTAQEAIALAREVGWTAGQGMAGPGSEVALLGKMGIDAVQQSANMGNIRAALAAGSPVAISTPRHYFAATGVDEAGNLDVGGSGTVFKGGSTHMTLDQIAALGGGLQSMIRLAGDAREQIAAVGTAEAATTASTLALSSAQQQSNVWAAQMTTEQAALSQVLAGQAPAMRPTVDAMTAFGQVLGPIERQVAGGSIQMETLRFKLVDLARATGLATKPWDDFNAGLIDIDEAMMRVVNQSSDAGPQFDALRQQLGTTNTITNQGTLDFLQLALAMGKVAPAQAAVISATTGLTSATGAVNNTVDPALYRDTADAVKQMTDALDGGSSAFGKIQQAAHDASDIVKEFLDASQSLGDYLSGHEFNFHVNLPDLPDWAIPGSPMPLETALRGLNSALQETNRISALTFGGIAMPALAGGGGDTYVSFAAGAIVLPNYNGDAPRAARELARAIESEFVTMKSSNGFLAFER